MKQLICFIVAVGASAAWADVKPTACWDGDFSEKTKAGITLSVGSGNVESGNHTSIALGATVGDERSAVTIPGDIAGRCEAWLCAGQSNMQMGWGAAFNSSATEKARVSAELAQLDGLDIRLWNFADGSWTRLDRTNALDRCAIGVSFAIRRARATGRPVAILYVAAGGAPTESFLSRALMGSLEWGKRPRFPTLSAMMKDGREIDRNAFFPCKWVAREYPRRLARDSEARWWGFSRLYEHGIALLRNVPLTGILWYQGESNATACVGTPDVALEPGYMRETLRAVVAELRGERKIPFLMFGLPALNRPWEPYRAAQKEVCAQMGATYIDTFAAGLGDLRDVHPRDKVPFAELAAAAAERAVAERLRISEEQVLWRSGENGVKCYRIPALATAPNGDLIAACDARAWHSGDLNCYTPINISVRRSCDGGRTWTAPVNSKTWPWSATEKWAGSDPSLIVDREAKKVFLLYNVWDWSRIPNHDQRLGVYRFYVQESADNGVSWSEAREITQDIAPRGWPVGKRKGEGAFVFVPSGSGTQLEDGMLLHTLVWVGKSVALFGSSDHGRTWRAVGRPTRAGGGDECKVVELSDGRWMINQRWSGGRSRFLNISDDRGLTWTPREDKALVDPACNGQLMRYGKSLLFSNCASARRENIRIRRSDDDGRTWDEGVSICPGAGMYSDIAELPDGRVGILYEDGASFATIRFAVVSGFASADADFSDASSVFGKETVEALLER